MPRSTRFTHALLLATLLLAGVHAAPISAELDVQAMDSPGPFTMQGSLAGLIQDDLLAESMVPSGDFDLRAENLRVETDEASTTLQVRDRTAYVPLDPVTNSDDFQDATVRGSEARAGFEFFVVPVASDGARIRVNASCGGLSPSGVDAQEVPPQVRDDTRPRTVIDSGDALHWQECASDATATVTGDFLVGLWEHSATLTAGNESVALESGRSQSSSSPHALTDDTITHDRQVFLYVTGGRLTLPLEAGVHRDLYVQDARVQSTSLLELRGATGALEAAGQSINLAGDEVLLQGTLVLDATGVGVGAAFTLTVAGDVDSAHVNGHPLTVSTAAAAGLPWLWVLVAAIVLGVGAGVVWFYVSPLRLFHQLRRARESRIRRLRPECNNHRRAAAWSWRAAQNRGQHPRLALIESWLANHFDPGRVAYLVQLAKIHQFMGHHRTTLRIGQRLRHLIKHDLDKARNACMMARSLHALGRMYDAQDALLDAESYSPVTAYKGLRELRDKPIGQELWFRMQLDRLQNVLHHSYA